MAPPKVACASLGRIGGPLSLARAAIHVTTTAIAAGRHRYLGMSTTGGV